MTLTVPHRRQERGIQRLEFLLINLQCVRERGELHVRRHHELLEFQGVARLDVAEILLRVVVDLERREERAVEIARGESEGAALVVADDGDDVVRAKRFLRAAHALGAVIVGGQRQRPGAQQMIVVGEQLRRRLRGAKRIEAVIH